MEDCSNEWATGLFSLGGVALGVFLTIGKDWIQSYRSNKTKAEYLAVRVTCALDRYVDGCVKIVNDYGMPNDRGFYEVQEDFPELDLESMDLEWKTLPTDIMYRILSFQNQIESAHRSIAHYEEYEASPPDYSEAFEERQYQYAKLGMLANIYASKLRKKYGLPDRKFNDYNPLTDMKKRYLDIKRCRKAMEEKTEKNLLENEIMNAN